MTSKIMNTPITPTPDLESLRKAIQEYQPDPSRIPFNNLKPFHDSIVELRGKNASYAAIAELLNNMASRPAGRVWPNTAASSWKAANRASGGNGRKPRQPQISRPRLKVRQPWPQNPRRHAAGNGGAMSHRHQKKASPYRSRGPHIANVRMMTPEEAKEFKDSLKPKPPAS
jgi:hypothetical protein